MREPGRNIKSTKYTCKRKYENSMRVEHCHYCRWTMTANFKTDQLPPLQCTFEQNAKCKEVQGSTAKREIGVHHSVHDIIPWACTSHNPTMGRAHALESVSSEQWGRYQVHIASLCWTSGIRRYACELPVTRYTTVVADTMHAREQCLVFWPTVVLSLLTLWSPSVHGKVFHAV